MANTTNFNWETPDDTDLVKDGALAIRTLGNSIDTTLVDLKGGTTGQVLSKTSNTDMDFTWVTSDDANAIQNAIVDAKGDLITATAADTPARIAVGNDGETLVVDSSTSTGLRWQAHIEAGKNALINGNFDIWQRGTSSSSLGAYTTADRWYLTAISGTGTFAQETTVKPSNSNYSLKFTASATAQPLIYQVIETANAIQFAGQTVVLSGKFASSASVTFSIGLEYSTSTDVGIGGSWTSITPSASSAASPTSTTFVNGSAVFAVPSTARSLRVSALPTATIANTVVLYWSQMQLEIGSVQTAFSRAGGTLAGELQAAQRYYYQYKADTGFRLFGPGMCYTTTTGTASIKFPVSMRTRPTALEQSGTASDYAVVNSAGSAVAVSAVPTFDGATSSEIGLVAFTVASGLTAGNSTILLSNNTASAYLGWSAEL